MTNNLPRAFGRSRLVSLALCALVVFLAIVFRARLGAWFSFPTTTGQQGLPAPGSTTASSSGQGANGAPLSARYPPAAASAAGEIDHYTCSMHPSVKEASPGTCPICGMDLIPVTKEQQSQGVVMIDEGRRQLIGVRTAAVTEGPLRSSFHAVGRIAYDESAFTDVNLKVRGWITKLRVNETGQRVTRGQTLFTMYSPELYNAEQDFLLANGGPGMDSTLEDGGAPRARSFARAARKRLNLLGLSDAQIEAVAAQGEPQENTAIASPATGFVIEKDVVEGASVDAGMRLFRIAALNQVWVEVDVYEADFARVRVGQAAKVTLDYLPGHSYDAKVSYVYPYLESGTRTGRVRIELGNQELELDPVCTPTSSWRLIWAHGSWFRRRPSFIRGLGGWCSSIWARADFARRRCASEPRPMADTRYSEG